MHGHADPQLTFIAFFLEQSRDVSLISLILQGRQNYAVQYPFISYIAQPYLDKLQLQRVPVTGDRKATTSLHSPPH